MQVDVGFGDLIHPDAIQANYPALLDLPTPSLRMYPPETVIAEKAEAMAYLGSLNSRMKDFYDIWRMSQQFNFKSADLCDAVRGTFGKRKTAVIEFDDLITELLDNETFQKQWTAFLSKSAIIGPEIFAEVLALIGKFLSPVFSSINSNKVLNQKWIRPGPWRNI
jgi:hypothetical protein